MPQRRFRFPFRPRAAPLQVLAGLAVLGLLAGCGPDADRYRRASDLAAALPLARVEREPGRLDLGTVAARAHLAAGWSGDETLPGGQTVARTTAREATLRFFLSHPRDLPLTLVCAPEGPAPGAVRLAVNGREVGGFDLAAGFWEHGFTLPAAALASGDNVLALRTAPGAGLVCDEVRFPGGAGRTGGERGEVRQAEGRVALPPGTRLDFFLRWPERPAAYG